MTIRNKPVLTVCAASLAAVALFAPCAGAAPASVKASIDSVQMLMGRMSTLRLQVVQDENARGHFPALAGGEAGLVALCGDSVELRTSVARDTTRLGSGRIQVDWAVPVQAFDSGVYEIPGLDFVTGRDTVRSNGVVLKVVPVTAKPDDPIAGLAPTAEPAGKSFWDFLPDWVVEYWWIVLIFLLAALIAVEEVLRRKKIIKPLAPKVHRIDPNTEAVQRLEELKARKLWESGREKEYFTILTDILRNYLDRRFGINAMEMTSRQIMQTLASDKTLREKRAPMRQILDMADFVKFAKVRPLPDDNVAAWNNALAFVNSTAPEPDPETKDNKREKSMDKKGGEA